ncbi:MAG: M1 family metallopeptidase [Christensenellales bacterium]|jgi:aminopeptidase N
MRSIYLGKNTLLWILAGIVVIVAATLVLSPLVRRADPRVTGPRSGLALSEQASAGLPRYDLDLTLDPERCELTGVLALDYVNLESVPIDALYFYVWPNSFSSEEYAVFEGEEERAYPEGFDRGELTIESVKAGGSALSWELVGAQKQTLRVALPEAVKPGQRARLTIGYRVTIPRCAGRFGYGEHTWSLVNAHPILAVCDDESGEWQSDYLYYSIGDPFYSDAADYTARIEVPPGYLVAATGSQTTTRGDDAWVTTVRGPAQRDFGFVASDDFDVVEVAAGDIMVRSWFYGSDWLGRRAAEAAAGALTVFSERFGDYCWDELDVVMCDFYVGGMEYPGMVLIDESTYTMTTAMIMEMIVAHETAHQWWYAAVGNNQIIEPWLDEALTEFSTALYFEDRYPKDGDLLRDNYVYASYDYMETMTEISEKVAIGSPVTLFSDNIEYALVVYGRGARMFDDLRAHIGEEPFYRALSDYYREHRFGIATGEDLIAAFSRAAGTDLTGWFSEYLNP